MGYTGNNQTLKSLNNINKWIEANKDTDPNCYEMIDSAFRVSEIEEGERATHKEVVGSKHGLKKMYKKRMKDLLTLVAKDSNLYNLMKEVYNYGQENAGNVTQDISFSEKEVTKKIAGVRLFIAQQQRERTNGNNIDVLYYNVQELEEIKNRLDEVKNQPEESEYRKRMQARLENTFSEIEKIYLEGQQKNSKETTILDDLKSQVNIDTNRLAENNTIQPEDVIDKNGIEI